MTKTNDLINEIKVPKSQYNSFGKYYFRNNEDIQTALKPMLVKYDLVEKASTEMLEMNGELMLHVHIDIYDPENKEKDIISGDGWAVIDVNKKGMDKAQATGASQSYASKYAYGQALKLDDTKDADSTNKGQSNVTQPKANKPSYEYKLSDLKQKVANKEMSSDRANELCKQGKVNMNA